MPTVLRKNGFQVIIWTNDHEPMHVHVFKAEGELVIDLGNDKAEVSIRENYGMRNTDLRRALSLISRNHDLLLEKWREIHG